MDDLLLYLLGSASLLAAIGLFLLADADEADTLAIPQRADDQAEDAAATRRRAA